MLEKQKASCIRFQICLTLKQKLKKLKKVNLKFKKRLKQLINN